MEITAMSNMLPSQVAPVTRVLSGAARSMSQAVEPSIIGCHGVGPCRVCCPFAGVEAQMIEIFDLPFAGVSAQ
jgi:hypothetical protein